ncbi:ATP-binding protein [Methanobrevibacter filiformis]|uniref:Putative AAA-ATPase n=1 Tax=Methanobrevibacter filiformis TaxID=55758 RepID=A0A166F4F6_9EURY|nr:ATP-binding protein [Methanobrevibacter filiformis]KZX17302.1 putative AAA-ATPase [Methanobrevibacter filiformis]
MNMKGELSVDVADFRKLIRKNKIYVDKTKVIKNIIDRNGTYYFLSRPRRFGKSLLISTLKELYEGNKELFKGTYIYDKWNWSETYPIILIDLNDIDDETIESFEESLSIHLDRIAKNFSINLISKSSKDKFSELIEEVYLLYKQEVVVLVDEYDKPILNKIVDTSIAIKFQEKLKNFYGTLKSADSKLKFVFVTGITKFSKVSIFSDFNNLIDLTLNSDYSTICGYTDKEVEKYFKKFIDYYANLSGNTYNETLKLIKHHYDGYSWDGENFLYNPYSLMNFFNDDEFNNYWFESGTPNFLIKLLKKDFNIGNIFKQLTLSTSEFKTFDIKNLKQIPLLFQSGYLTIVKKEYENGKPIYTLKIPNNEVEESITENLFNNFLNKAENTFASKRKEIWQELKNGKCELLIKYLKKEIVNTPYQLKIRNWKYYQTLIYFIMKSLGFNTNSEISMFSGRLDIAIEEDSYFPFYDEKGNVIVIEVKYTQQKNRDIETLSYDAINQIKEKKYYEFYGDVNIIIIGLAIKEVKLKIGGSRIDMKCEIEKVTNSC